MKGEKGRKECSEVDFLWSACASLHSCMQTTTNQAIFRVEAAICRLFREYLTSQQFVEIHTPKIISGEEEGPSFP